MGRKGHEGVGLPMGFDVEANRVMSPVSLKIGPMILRLAGITPLGHVENGMMASQMDKKVPGL